MNKNLQYPKTPFDLETYQNIIDIARKMGVSEETINTMKSELHFDELGTYPDGTGNPAHDIATVRTVSDKTLI